MKSFKSDARTEASDANQACRTQVAIDVAAEANLYYYRARYYDPNAGRFLNERSYPNQPCAIFGANGPRPRLRGRC